EHSKSDRLGLTICRRNRLFKPVVDAEQRASSSARNEVAGMWQIDVETVQDIVEIGLELKLFPNGSLQHCAENPVTRHLFHGHAGDDISRTIRIGSKPGWHKRHC